MNEISSIHQSLILSTSQLCVGFKSNEGINYLFNDLNLSLKSGEFVCLMGPNGIGKSSLIRTLAGLQKPLHGVITIENNTEKSLPRQIAVVLTNRFEGGNMTVRELITFGRYPYLNWNVCLTPEDKHHIDKAIEKVHIQNIVDKKIAKLSDGQLQMAMIARAIAQDTPVILLDEPTAHLDLNNRVEIMKLLLSLSRQMNKAILVATHELDLALQTADVILLAGKEKNILTGIPEHLVLNGDFDEIFQFKGFDLKTGKIQHHAFREMIILEGHGSAYLWTKNALERLGFNVIGPDKEKHYDLISVILKIEEGKPQWILKKNNRQYNLFTISELIGLIFQRLRTT